MTVESNRLLGFAAAVLTAVGTLYGVVNSGLNFGQLPFPSTNTAFSGMAGWIAISALVGLILFLVAMWGFSKDYKDPVIFNNALYAFISSLILGFLVGAVVIAFVLMNTGSLFPLLPGGGTPNVSELMERLLRYIVPVFPVISFLGIIPAAFNMRAFNRLSEKSNVALFRIVGLLGLAAAAASGALQVIAATLILLSDFSAGIIFTVSVVGSAISLAAWILAAKAFYSIKPSSTQTAPAPTAPPTVQMKSCPNCGAENSLDAAFCSRCGNKL